MNVFKYLGLNVLSLISITSCGQQDGDLPVQSFSQNLGSEKIQLLDVRTDKEFKSGHLENALWADWNKPDEFNYRIQGLDKSKPVYTYCLSGGRSASAAKLLREKGFTVYNLKGGINAWKQEGMPLEEANAVKQLTLAEYETKIAAEGTVLVDFGAEWCPPCKKMSPVVDSLSSSSNLSFNLVKIDAGEQTELGTLLHVEALPTFIIYKNNKEIWRKSGIIAADDLAKQLK